MIENAEIRYRELKPDEALAYFVKRFWQFENLTEQPQHYTVLPDGYFDLIIKVQNNQLQSVSLFGIWTQQANIIVPTDTTVIGITFKPLAADALQLNIDDVLDSFKTLDNTFWSIDKLPYQNLENCAQGITSLLLTATSIDNRKKDLFHYLFTANGALTVKQLSGKVFWSSRQINRYFNENFGLSLKAYSSILRCAASYTDIRDGDLYPQQNYYDQAHFIKEVKKHTGFRPKQLHLNENDRFLQFSTLAKK